MDPVWEPFFIWNLTQVPAVSHFQRARLIFCRSSSTSRTSSKSAQTLCSTSGSLRSFDIDLNLVYVSPASPQIQVNLFSVLFGPLHRLLCRSDGQVCSCSSFVCTLGLVSVDLMTVQHWNLHFWTLILDRWYIVKLIITKLDHKRPA